MDAMITRRTSDVASLVPASASKLRGLPCEVRIVLGILILTGLGCLSPQLQAQNTASKPLPPPLSRSPYLQFQTPNSIRVVWRTDGPIDPVVRYGTSLQQLGKKVGENDIVTRASLGTNGQPMLAKWEAVRTPKNLRLPKLHSAPIGTFQYETPITDLQPATQYFYAVYDGDKRLTPEDPTYSFTTPPPVGTRQRYRFWVIGDSGTGRIGQWDVHQRMLEKVKQDGKPLDFWIHVGDMAYGTGRDVEFQSRFFESYEVTLRSSVCWPTMGNHEGANSKGTTAIGPYYDAYVVPTRGEAGGIASGTEAYYAFNHGNIHFICLDSHDLDRKPTGTMAKWLKADLEKAKADWIIAFFHHPPYTKGSHDADKEKDLIEMRQHIMPILEAGGVDVVLTGHSHIYERSMLMDGAYGATMSAENAILDDGDGDPNGDGAYLKSAGITPHQGTVQVVAGHGGQSLGRAGSAPMMKRTLAEWGSVLFDLDHDTLTAIMLNRNGKTRDSFTLIKRGRVTPQRLALPWQPPEYKKPANEPKQKDEGPVDFKVLIPRGAEWQYLADRHPRGQSWTTAPFDASNWKTAPSGFGYGDIEFKTSLADMRTTRQTTAYFRKSFQIEQADKVTELGLRINYSDCFVAYINGREVARQGVGRSAGRNAQGLKRREDSGMVYIGLKDVQKCLVDGTNFLAIEVHSAGGESQDLVMDASLILED